MGIDDGAVPPSDVERKAIDDLVALVAYADARLTELVEVKAQATRARAALRALAPDHPVLANGPGGGRRLGRPSNAERDRRKRPISAEAIANVGEAIRQRGDEPWTVPELTEAIKASGGTRSHQGIRDAVAILREREGVLLAGSGGGPTGHTKQFRMTSLAELEDAISIGRGTVMTGPPKNGSSSDA